MDAKITKLRLSRMLSYDWLKIVAIAVAAIIVWVLIFTMTATRITCAQSFVVYNYVGNVSLSNTKFSSAYSKAFNGGVFSYEVLEATYYDLTLSESDAYTVMQAHLSADEGDAVFVADIDNPSASYKDGEETRYDSYVQTMLGSFGYYFENLDRDAEQGFFKRMERYIGGYYENGDFENGALDEDKVAKDFRARAQKNKDKRYKKEEQIVAGIAQDVQRIRKYRDALLEFYGYLDEEIVRLEQTTVYDRDNGNAVLTEGTYTINLCPDEATMGKLSEYVAYTETRQDENTGEELTVSTAKNMHVGFIKMAKTEVGFEYESLLYVNDLIRTYRTQA